MIKNRFIRCVALSAFAIPGAMAATGHAYLGTSLAGSHARLGNSSPQISYFSGATITDAYPLNDNYALKAVWGINGGYQFTGQDKMPSVALGLGAYSTLSGYGFDGRLIETAAGDSGATLYHYDYKIKSARLMAEAQLSWAFGEAIPFVDAGIGAAWNRSSGYGETAVTSMGYPPLPGFQSRTHRNLAWQAGFGLGEAFNFGQSKSDYQHERMAIGYRYVDTGTASFGGRNAIYPYALNLGTLRTNDVYISYTHLF